MSAPRFAVLVLIAGLFALPATAHSQGSQKGKPKPGAPLAANPGDLPKPGTALSPYAMVQRPATLSGVRSWSIETKRHRWSVTHMSARPDGKKVATSGYDGLIRIWDADTGNFERALIGHEGYVYGLAWSPDGNYLASAGYYPRVWDGKTGLPVRVLKDPKPGAVLVAWSPDGTRLLTGGGGSGQLAVWDVSTGKQLAATEYGNPIQSIAWSPSGDFVAAAASRAGTYVADPAHKLKTVHTFKEAQGSDNAVAFSPDGKRLAVGSATVTAIYDLAEGTRAQSMATGATMLAWTPKGGLLVLAPTSQVIPHAAGNLTPGTPLPGAAGAISLVPDGSALFGLYGGDVTRWDLEKGASVRTWPVAEYLTLTCGPATAVLVPGTPPALWDPTTGKRIGGLDEHKGALGPVAWAPGGKTLAVAAADRSIRVYETATARSVRALTAPAAVVAVALSANGKVACSAADGKVAVWAATGDQPRHTLTGIKSAPALAWTRDGRLLAAAGGKEVVVWSADTGKQLKALEHPRDVYSVTWSPDATRLVVGSSEDVALACYQASTWKLQPSLDRGTNALAVVASQWSPDGGTLLGYRNSAIQQWNAKTGRLGPAIGSPAGAACLGFWPDGKTVAGGCVDRAARYWDSATGRLRMTVVVDRDQFLAVSAEGHYRFPESAEGEVVAVVLTDKAQETMPLRDLAARHGFRNVPGNVK